LIYKRYSNIVYLLYKGEKMDEINGASGRTPKFFLKPKVWKALVVAVGYMIVYLGVSQLVARGLKLDIPEGELLTVPEYIYKGFMLPIAITSVLLAGFAAAIGWLKPLFSRQTVKGSKWMWIGPIAVSLYIVGHFLSADYSKVSFSVIIAILIATAFVGFTEELLTRGFMVKMVRESGKSEFWVAVISSLVFGLMHSTNILTGQSLSNTAVQLVITFMFGIVMYISLRVTGFLWVTILLHWLYDASLFIQTGSITSSEISAVGPFAIVASFSGILVPLVGFLSLFFIRGNYSKKTHL
jgi:membrane protease YdiL (CAAX protease family)